MVDPADVAAIMYEGDHAVRALGIEIVEVGPGRAVTRFVVDEQKANQHGVCHGGLIFTLADTAMAYASNGANEKAFASAASIDFINGATVGMRLTAVAEEQSLRGRAGIYDISVTADEGTLIALFRGNTLRVGGAIVDDATP